MNQYVVAGGLRIEIIAAIRKEAKKRGITLGNLNSNKRRERQFIDGKNLRFYIVSANCSLVTFGERICNMFKEEKLTYEILSPPRCDANLSINFMRQN